MDDAVKLVPHHSHWGAFLAEVVEGRFVGVRPFPRDPDPSPLIEAMPAAVYAPTRIAAPMVREGFLARRSASRDRRGREAFVQVSWERALDLVAGELDRVKRTHGHAAIMGGSQGWGSAGIFHDARAQIRRFLAAFGGFVDQTSNYSFGAALTFLPHVLGSAQAVSGPLTSWSSIARHTRLLVLFGGANPKNLQVTKGGGGEHNASGWMAALGRAGVEVINVSPIRDDGPEAAGARWIAIRPNTDTALLLALTHTLVAEGLHDQDFLARYCEGFARVEPYLMGTTDAQPKNAEWAASITGVGADTIRSLARRMAATRTMVSASWSLQRADHGEQPYWGVILLAAALGQIGLPGGGFGFGYGSTSGIAEPPLAFGPPAMESLGNPLGRAIPAARITDCLLHPGSAYDYNGKAGTYPDIRLVYWAGGNPFHHHQDLNRLRRAFARPDTIIVHESGWTASARHADIVLPATVTLEREDFGGSPGDPLLVAMHRVVPPYREARDDYDIFADLAQRLGITQRFTEGRPAREWLRHLYEPTRRALLERGDDAPDFEEFWEAGELTLPRLPWNGGIVRAFRRDPETMPLPTPSGKIEIASARIAEFGYTDCPGQPAWLPPSETVDPRFPLQLIANQPATRLHSQLDFGATSLASKIKGREPVRIHPQDAAARGIGDGDIVRLYNDRGACLAGAVLSDALRPGVVQLSTGAWYDPDDPTSDKPLCVHGNPNVLTRDAGTSKLAQGCTGQLTQIDIERFDGPLPPIRAYDPPIAADY